MPLFIVKERSLKTASESGDQDILALQNEIIEPCDVLWTEWSASSILVLFKMVTEERGGGVDCFCSEPSCPLRQNISMRLKQATPCTMLGTNWQNSKSGSVKRPIKDRAVKAFVVVNV